MNRRRFLRATSLTLAGAALSSCARWAPASEPDATPSADDAPDALELAARVRRGEVSPSELLEDAIRRTETLNPRLNAVVIEHFDRARALAKSDRIPDGPLRGVPFLLKDLGVTLEGTITSHGSRFFRDAVATSSSTLVERYERAGLVIFGKTASPEFGSSSSTESLAWGETHNPWNPDYSSGGSSGGSAVAVAAGIVPVAHASDGGGSIRIPASCCGLFGLKPTRGRTPHGPAFFDKGAGVSTDHVISRSVRDSAALLDATSGPAPYDPYRIRPPARPYLEELGRSPGRLRIGVQRRATLPVETHPDCLAALEATADLCASLGHELEEIEPPPLPGADLWHCFGVLRGTTIAMRIAKREQVLGRKVTPDDLEPQNWGDYQRALGYTAIDYETQRQRVYRWARSVAAHQADFDAVLSPTLGGPPPRLGVLDPSRPDDAFAQAAMQMAGFTIAYNLSGQPAMSVPLHWNEAGLPIGSMFVAQPGREDLLFRLAAQLEAAAPWAERRPPIAA